MTTRTWPGALRFLRPGGRPRAHEEPRYSMTGLADRIWSLRDNVTAYDACYVALAEALDYPLVTSDARLARATGHHAQVEVCPHL